MSRNARLSVNICPKCKQRLDSYGQPAAKLVDTVCYYYLEGVPIFIDSDDESAWKSMGPVLAFLENKGYLLSSECTHSMLSLEPGDCDFDGDAESFCWCEKTVMC